MSETALTTTTEKAKIKKAGFRPDIQGLRAVAVLVVILDHLFHFPTGGYVGVDVFFVISGFLITGLLVREYEKTGTISFADFYRRRIRRILPAAMLALVTTVIATWLIFAAVRAQAITWDAIWAALFAANWRFASVGTDYSQVDGPVSPLQHYWSLSVEEQFYFVWPLLMVGVFLLAKRSVRNRSARKSRAMTLLTALMGALVVLSFAWAVWETATSPTLAYFSTFSRAWELGLGALLAVLTPRLSKLPDALRPVMHWLGLGLIAASLVTLDNESVFPGPWALLPVAGSCFVIAAGIGRTPRSAFLLTNPVARYIGDASFSLYLWHWPVIVLTAAFFPDEDAVFYLTAIAIFTATSLGAYHFVEEPIRRSRWLNPATKNSAPTAFQKRWDRFLDQHQWLNSGNVGLGVLALTIVGVVTLIAVVPTSLPGTQTQAAAGPQIVTTTAPPVDPSVDLLGELRAEIDAAVYADAFPELTPGLDQLDRALWFKQVVSPAECLNVVSDALWASCATGPEESGKDVVVLGDSFAIAWLPGIRSALEPLGWRVHSLTMGECPVADVPVSSSSESVFTACNNLHSWRNEKVAELKPELTILAQSHQTVDRLVSGATGDEAADELAAGFRATVDAVAPSSGATLILSAPPSSLSSLQSCKTNVAVPGDCDSPPGEQWQTVIDAERAALADAPVTYVSTKQWFCNSASCPSFVGTIPVHVDQSHISIQYAQRLAPLIAEEVAKVVPATS